MFIRYCDSNHEPSQRVVYNENEDVIQRSDNPIEE